MRSEKFEHPAQQVVFQEYVDTVVEARARVAGLEEQMHQALEGWTLHPVVEGLIALRGVDVVTAMTVLAELGDLTRFDSPRELMSFLGLVPSEHSSGQRRRQGAITKTGNGHVRRVLVESAWSYRFPARKTMHLRCKAQAARKRPGNGVMTCEEEDSSERSSVQVGGGEPGRQQRFDVAERLGPGQIGEHPTQVRVGFESVRLRALNERVQPGARRAPATESAEQPAPDARGKTGGWHFR